MTRSSDESFDYLLDASGLQCPMPLLKAKMQLNKMAKGERLKVLATDAGSVRDFKSFMSLTSNTMQYTSEQNGQFIYIIEKGEAPS